MDEPARDDPATDDPALDDPAAVGPAADEPGDGASEDAGAGVGGSGGAGSADRDQLDRLAALIGPRLDEARALLDEAGTRWRGDAVRVGEGTRQRLRDLARELGLVTREEWDELELRVAQVEHRLRLLEERSDAEDG